MSTVKEKTAALPLLPGMEDAFPADARRFRYLEDQARDLFARHGYGEVRTPILELTELFDRTVGEAADVVVSKQMYTFTDLGGRSNTLRPEGTAGVVRAVIEDGLLKRESQAKLFYVGPMFRYETKQKGRLRQFHQIGAEFFGVAHPAADAEIIALCNSLLRGVGFQDIITKVNNLGCRECRRGYNERLREAIATTPGYCEQCLRRAATNPMRVFDCKVESCKELVKSLPKIAEFVCEPCRTHFDAVLRLLDAAHVPYERDGDLVRGFDYYTRTVFEVAQSAGLGSQNAILGGGRYDELVEELGGPPTPAVGMGMGIERILLVMEALGLNPPDEAGAEYYVLALDDASLPAAFSITTAARTAGEKVAFDCQPRSMKAGFKGAEKAGARYLLIVGENELARGVVQKKDLQAREQIEVPLSELTGWK